jgi:hypothetical protein
LDFTFGEVMKGKDFGFFAVVLLFFTPFFLIPSLGDFYHSFNASHGVIMSFIKFALLATLGESIGLRIRTGNYNVPGFGILPRAIVWGILGVGIKMAFIIFATGTPLFLKYMGLVVSPNTVNEPGFSLLKLLTAFSISVALNTIFAPIFMTIHKVTDSHITEMKGTLKGFFTPIDFGRHLRELNWEVQWGFVFKKTIPLFWIPAHTLTFMLPPQHRILFAAFLGVVLGVILSIAALKGKS